MINASDFETRKNCSFAEKEVPQLSDYSIEFLASEQFFGGFSTLLMKQNFKDIPKMPLKTARTEKNQ